MQHFRVGSMSEQQVLMLREVASAEPSKRQYPFSHELYQGDKHGLLAFAWFEGLYMQLDVDGTDAS